MTLLSADAYNALLCRQLMKGFPEHLRLKLLDSDPTPTLDNMFNSIQRFRAVHRSTEPVLSFAAAFSHPPASSKSTIAEDKLYDSIGKMTTAVTTLTTSHKDLHAAINKEETSYVPRRKIGLSTERNQNRPNPGLASV